MIARDLCRYGGASNYVDDSGLPNLPHYMSIPDGTMDRLPAESTRDRRDGGIDSLVQYADKFL